MDIGYITPSNPVKEAKANKSYEQVTTDEFANNIGKL
jgi:hypothetical protein